MKSKRMNKKSKRNGQALVEMALVVTVLLFLTMGLIQYGLISNARITMTNLAREGARFAAVHATESGSDTSTNPALGIKAYVVQVAQSTPLRNITTASVTVTPAEGNAARTSGQPITVTVTYNLRSKFIMPISFPGLGRIGTTSTATAIMVIE